MGSPTAPTQNIKARPASGDSDNNLLRKIDGILATGAGLGGNDIFSDTATHVGTWGVLHALTDVAFTTVTFEFGHSSGTLAGSTLKAGDRLYGDIRSVKLFVGTAILYRSVL